MNNPTPKTPEATTTVELTQQECAQIIGMIQLWQKEYAMFPMPKVQALLEKIQKAEKNDSAFKF